MVFKIFALDIEFIKFNIKSMSKRRRINREILYYCK